MLLPCDGHPAVPVSLPLGSASPPGVVGSPAGCAGEEQVEPATGVVEQADRLGHLLLTADLGDLRDGAHDEADRLAQRAEAVLGRGGVPHGVELLAVLVDVGAARVGQVDHRPALGLLGAHQAFVGQLRHRRVHRARAGAPGPAGALGDLLDDLVAVHRLLGEQREDRRAHVTARPSSTAAAARAAEAARTAEATTRSATGASEAPGAAEARAGRRGRPASRGGTARGDRPRLHRTSPRGRTRRGDAARGRGGRGSGVRAGRARVLPRPSARRASRG